MENQQYWRPKGLGFKSVKDIFRVIFDNLILNSIQQNDAENLLDISRNERKYMHIEYSDNGKSFPDKYKFNPMRILEVRETSRKGGHGIGMWIVNNTVINTRGRNTED